MGAIVKCKFDLNCTSVFCEQEVESGGSNSLHVFWK